MIDKGKIHQDHAVAVRGVVAMLTAAPGAFYTALSPDPNRPLSEYRPLYF